MIRCQSQERPYRTIFTNGTFSGACDAPPDKGGEGDGFRPHELLEAALGSCLAMTLSMYARHHRLPLEEVTVSVTLERPEAGTSVFACDIRLTGDLSETARARLLRAARACPVRKTLAGQLVVVEKD
ncbi:OsmC family protein [Solidesulfovibrio carbinoliphilus subsp. oakridgensis]|uniref:OsmC family protein n=1 Tax=Solidesulfovibrio carbinoliphilus subsp. oakridgensis TaxID=694327 RepID=G7Q4A4_9BACT|nr:OsmC family protein [Solidesulfovibrio carbinoliphilus]EHJ46972.1 OsmC family protein [Solidesulfovibrio carbinoliphilus subsp. oakridgensis]